MSLKIEDLKSAEVLTDREEIGKRIKERFAANRPAAGSRSSCSLREAKDGRVEILKQSGLIVAKDAPTLPSVEELRALATLRKIPWKESYADRVQAYWASDERVDAHGDIVRQNWIFDEFEKNSPLCFNHNWADAPIGGILKWATAARKESDYEGPALWLLSLFADSETSPTADGIFRLVKSGFLKAGSVGFFSDKVIDVKDEAERTKLGLGRWGLILDANHLLEYSPTTLGANSGAFAILANAKKSEGLKPEDLVLARELKRQEFKAYGSGADLWVKEDREFCALAKTLFPERRFEAHKDFDEPISQEGGKKTRLVTRAGDEGTIDLEALSAKVDALQVTLETALVGLGQQMADVLEICEAIRDGALTTEGKAGGDADGEKDTADGKAAEGSEKGSEAIDRILAKLGS